MKKTILLIICLVAIYHSYSQTFAKRMGSTTNDYGRAIVTDAAGNIYTTGPFSGTVDFDPGAATANLISAGTADIFVSKLDANGNYVWAKSMGGIGTDISYGIAVDAAGNVYTTGYFTGTADFDPGAATANLTSAGSNDIFVSKLDAAGNYVWAKIMGGTVADVGWVIAIDAAGNVYTTGSFGGTADFDPGAGILNLTSAGGTDIFISKLDANGNYVWAKAMGGTGFDAGYGITTDAAGNVYTTGNFAGTADFDPGAGILNLTSAGGSDIFVSKMDATGNYVWAKGMGGTGGDIGIGINTDAAGNVYTTGYFNGTADFDPGAATANLTSAGSADIFVSKLDAAGNYVWAKAMGGISTDTGYGIAVDAAGNVYTTGYFNGTADFDPGAGILNLTSAGSNDIFVSKLDATGNYVWAKGMGGAGTDYGWGIAIDAAGNVYTTGSFNGTADFDPGAGILNLTSAGSNDIFVSKLNSPGVLPLRLLSFTGSTTATGNTLQWQTADEVDTKQFIVERSTDGRSFGSIGTVTAKGAGNAVYNYTDAAPFTDYVYYRLKMMDIDGKFTYSTIIRLTNQQTNQPTNQLTIYPNPVKDNATLQVNDKKLVGATVKIIDATGKPVQTFIIRNNFEIVDMSSLSPGLYILQTVNGGTQKLIRQ